MKRRTSDYCYVIIEIFIFQFTRLRIRIELKQRSRNKNARGKFRKKPLCKSNRETFLAIVGGEGSTRNCANKTVCVYCEAKTRRPSGIARTRVVNEKNCRLLSHAAHILPVRNHDCRAIARRLTFPRLDTGGQVSALLFA